MDYSDVLAHNPRWTDADRATVRSHLARLGVTRVHRIPSRQYMTCFNAAGQTVMQVEKGHLLFPSAFARPMG